jgi:hypothetical protein
MRTEKPTRAIMSTIRWNIALPTLLFLLAMSGAIAAQSANAPKPRVKSVQVPFASLKPSATLKIGGTADWVLAGTKPCLGGRTDTRGNKVIGDKVRLSD